MSYSRQRADRMMRIVLVHVEPGAGISYFRIGVAA